MTSLHVSIAVASGDSVTSYRSMPDIAHTFASLRGGCINIWINTLAIIFIAIDLSYIDYYNDHKVYESIALIHVGAICLFVTYAITNGMQLMYSDDDYIKSITLSMEQVGLGIAYLCSNVSLINMCFTDPISFALIIATIIIAGTMIWLMKFYGCNTVLLYTLVTIASNVSMISAYQQPADERVQYYTVTWCIILLAGAFIHISKMPEILLPGAFDVFGASYQWWYISLIVVHHIQTLTIINIAHKYYIAEHYDVTM